MTDILSHNGAKEDFEDGELPEDGEICDDDDGAAPPRAPTPPMAAAHVAPAAEKPSRETPRAERVRRFEQNSPPRERERERERERDSDPFGSHNDAPDGNEYFGDKDYRSGAAASSEEEPFADTDYRVTRRRRLSPAHDEDYDARVKRPFFGARGGFRGGFRNGVKPRFQTEHQICKFFREGYCRDGDKCSYSHQAEDSLRRPQLCNFYANSFCKKGLQCLMLHGEFPCKQFHKNQCHNDNCRYSHVPLTDYTRPLIEKLLADDELRQQPQPTVYRQNPVANAAAAAAAAQVMAPRRRVLLPGGMLEQKIQNFRSQRSFSTTRSSHPCSHPTGRPSIPTSTTRCSRPNDSTKPNANASTARIPPTRSRWILQCSISRTPPRTSTRTATTTNHRTTKTEQYGTDAAAAATDDASWNAFDDLPHLQQPGLVVPQVVAQPERRAASPPAFDLNEMLNKLANSGKVKSSPKPVDDSPASPPPMFGNSNHRVPVIPQHVQVIWGLVRVQKGSPYSSVENPDKIANNDPRRAKAISKQFDAFSSLLGASGTGVVSDPRLRAQKEKADAVAKTQKDTKSAFGASWMPRVA
ncbi:Protein CBG18471 [Caenorhabditis briggsae]|uniref:Protein CBG18471 n=1 Tax=Caenorhabditis briggsae TaxID=6238 RepID=A8XTE0_CAEBR|nr:Protein CBG18471 [Caenorhabditis briggsae]CAP35917.2 Protein CBG18471 [Caenorhabditis briggsae]